MSKKIAVFKSEDAPYIAQIIYEASKKRVSICPNLKREDTSEILEAILVAAKKEGFYASVASDAALMFVHGVHDIIPLLNLLTRLRYRRKKIFRKQYYDGAVERFSPRHI